MFVGFVIQLSVNSITPANSLRPQEYIDIQSKQTDWAHSVPAVFRRFWTQTLTTF